jgi:serine/threonine-protein kinase
MGSPHYMSPEHVRGARDIDFRSDLWSLGVIMFRACTGRLPFDSDVVGDVIGKILADPIPKATSLAKDLPPSIDEFFARALARDRNQRYQSAKEMAEDFAEIVRSPSNPRISRPPSLTSLNPASSKGPLSLSPLSGEGGENTFTPSTTVDSRRAQPGNPAVLKGIAAGAAVVIAAGLMVILLARGPSAEPAAQPEAAANVPAAQPTVAPNDNAKPAPTAIEQPAAATTAAAATAPTGATTATPADTAAGTQKATAAKPGTTSVAKPAASNKTKKSWGF